MRLTERMPEHRRAAMLDWLTLHQIDPTRVPIDTHIDHDTATNEWRVEVYRQRNGRPYLDRATDTIPRAVIRRRWRAPCPALAHPCEVADRCTLAPACPHYTGCAAVEARDPDGCW